MKKFLLLVACVAVLFLGYKLFFAGGPKKAFTGFCDAWGANQLDRAWTFSVKEEVTAGFKGKSANEVTRFMMEAIMGSRTTVESSSKGPNPGEKTLSGTTLILFTPPGVTSAFPTHFASVRVQGALRKTPSGWKVTAFEPKLAEIGEIRRR